MEETGVNLKIEDSPFSICPGKSISRIEFNEKLNIVFAGTTEGDLYVVDPVLGEILYHSVIGVDTEASWDFNNSAENIVIVKKDKIGIRTEYNGIFLLDTILQTSVKNSSENILVELSKTEVETLAQALSSIGDTNLDVQILEDHVRAILRKLDVQNDNERAAVSIKKEKWTTVKLDLPQSCLKNAFQSMVTEWCKKNSYIPQLATASSALDRANILLQNETELDVPLDKTQMFSESARFSTFSNWPHMDYKWALPDKMAQAGFYHSPSTAGDDRSMCFTCNVCLVSWEPTDEPWSEHERHSPFCPFVRGEHTHNVPLSIQYATAPAYMVKKNVQNPIIAKSSYANCTAVGYSNGMIFIWDAASKQKQEPIQFEVASKTIEALEPIKQFCYSDIEFKSTPGFLMESQAPTPSSADAKLQLASSKQEDKVLLTAISILGCPPKLTPNVGNINYTPSLVVAVTTKSRTEPIQTPILLVYALNLSTYKPDKSSVKPVVQSTGSKQEGHESEDDLYGSYTSECDLMSDSISIFDDLNMSDASGTIILEPVLTNESSTDSFVKLKQPQPTSAKTPSTASKPKPAATGKTGLNNIVLAQKLSLPSEIERCPIVSALIPTLDGTQLIVIVVNNNKGNAPVTDGVVGAFIVYNVLAEINMVLLDRQNYCVRKIEYFEELPVSTCLIPSEYEETELCYVLRNGTARILSLFDLTTVCSIQRSTLDSCITSASYCSSLGRLYCGTNSGRIEMYSFGSSENLELKSDFIEPQAKVGVSTSTSTLDDPRLIVNRKLSVASLKQLLQLTSFENIKPCFAANAPPCWIKVIQAQKERKHPQHLQHLEKDYNLNTLTWRLQRTKNSKIEHLFEITLPHPTYVGHLDLKFLLQSGCTSIPTIEVTLYRINKKKSSHVSSDEVDSRIDFTKQLKNKEQPSNELFLKSVGAEVVCGPLDLAAYVDLSCQSANIVMTSPVLILSKTRNFYLYIKANISEQQSAANESSKNTPKQSSTKASSKPKLVKNKPVFGQANLQKMNTYQSVVASGYSPMEFGSVGGSQLPYTPIPYTKVPNKSNNESENINQNKELFGCDWIQELSISIRQVKRSTIPNEDVERKSMLTSSELVSKLLDLSIFQDEENSYAGQSIALDLLVWIAAVNLCGPQIANSCYQTKFISEIEGKLKDLILHCILNADRSTSHKCARLLVICLDAAEMHQPDDDSFLSNVLKSLLELLPFTVSSASAGSLQWFFLLLSRVKTQNLSDTSESLLRLFTSISKELSQRTNPLHALLRTRFGLYGLPFDADLFELELPPFTKSFSHSLNYAHAGICASDPSNSAASSDVSHLWGLKDVDFRELLVGNPLNLRWSKLAAVSPKQQIQGLLEVEPLHFTCHAASDGTRIEKIDQGGTSSPFSTVPLPQPFEPFTNLQTGEGSKKSEPDKMEQILMLQKALKMDHGEAYFDVLNDLKYYESDINQMDKGYKFYSPYNKHVSHFSNQSPLPPNWKGDNVLTVVLKHPNSSLVGSGPSNWSTPDGNPFAQPALIPTSFGGISYSNISNNISNMIGGELGFSSGFKSPITYLPSNPTPTSKPNPTPSSQSSKPTLNSSLNASSNQQKAGDDGLRLLLSPWQQMMYVPPQQALVIDRMHSGARRFVVLDFGSPILLTDMVIPSSNDLVSMSIDIWLHREEVDGQRLIVASDIGRKPLVICDLQPPPVCRYLKITVIGRYGMGNTKCKIPVGMFYGHTTILPNDLNTCDTNIADDICILSPSSIQAHLSVLTYLVEDLGCRYQLAGVKLKRLLEPLTKTDISSLDHISYYLPKGKERSKLGLNNSTDQAILSAYQDSIVLQQQLNVAKNVIKRLQKSLTCGPEAQLQDNPLTRLSDMCTDKIRLLNEFLIESLLGTSYIASYNNNSSIQSAPSSLYIGMTQELCENLFHDVCVLQNGQCQLSTCALMLRVCGFQPWWGKFLASTIKNLFSSSNNSMFPQDRVFILLVYLGQKAILCSQNSSVLECIMELLKELLVPLDDQNVFLRAHVDMTLLGWVVMYLSLCMDGINCTISDVTDPNHPSNVTHQMKIKKGGTLCTTRWDFIQGESALFRGISSPTKALGPSVFKRRIQKKILATKQKLEELDTVASGLGYSSHMMSGVSNHLAALGNKIEAIKQKQANINKNTKLQSSKNFKDILQMRRNEMFSKYGIGSKFLTEDSASNFLSDVEVNLRLDLGLCLSLSKSLGFLLLHMDSTCHSDIYLIVCKTLAKIATTCRPTVPLGSILNFDQVVRLIITAVGNDFVKQRSWSSSWISHAIICLFQDILEGERTHQVKSCSEDIESFANSGEGGGGSIEEDVMTAIEESMIQQQDSSFSEDMSIDDAEVAIALMNEDVAEAQVQNIPQPPMEPSHSLDSEDSDNYVEFIDLTAEDPDSVEQEPKNNEDNSMKEKLIISSKRFPLCLTSISTALDARLETRVESTTELRLRLMSVLDSEVLTQSLRAPIEVPEQWMKTKKPISKTTGNPIETISSSPTSSLNLLSSCFDHIFSMLSSENCSINVEKLLQFWISLNLDMSSGNGATAVKPDFPLSRKSISTLIAALTHNTGIGVQDWGLGFQCLGLVANQRRVDSENGDWHHILCDPNFPQLILKFISGSGLNAQRNNIASAGPTVCQHFYNFLFRLRELSSDSQWTLYLKEILLRVLESFLCGPVLNTNFPFDAFNKFLDRVCCPDLSYESLSTIVNIIQNYAQILHQFAFYPNKMMVRSSCSLKYNVPTPSTSSTNSSTNNNNEAPAPEKCQGLENVMFRLTSLVSSIIQLPFKKGSSLDKNVRLLLDSTMNNGSQSNDDYIAHCLAKCMPRKPKTVADFVLQMEPTTMRILSVLANSNSVSSLNGELSKAFTKLDSAAPATFIDAIVHLFNRLCICASQPQWTVQSLFKFLSKSAYDDFYCPLIVSEPFVVMVLKVIEKKEHLEQFMTLNCVQSVCDKLVSSTQKFFSSCPTFVSLLTQYIGRSDANTLLGQKRYGADAVDLQDGILNVAPLGNISATNFSAHPSEVLLQPSPPHRRARSPVWSYHFFPEEKFLELVITLPCAVLLKEIQIVPHITSLPTTCPSAVMLELSRGRNNLTIPMGPPLQCAGMTTINIQLSQPEVAQTVLVRLFKPKDSSNLGLSQIRLMGCTAFSEAALIGLSQNSEVKNLETSTHWMHILDRVIGVADPQIRERVVSTAVNFPKILESCYSLLMAPIGSVKSLGVYLPHVSSVLFHFGSCRKDISEQLMSALLGPVQMGFSHGMVVSPNSKQDVGVSQLNTVVELIYNLCCHIPEWGYDNLVTLIGWLSGLADKGINGNLNFKEIVPEYIQGVAATLWTIAEQRKIDLSAIVTADLLRKLLNWTIMLDNKSELKAALDHMICSVCFCKPWLFVCLMNHMGMIKEMDWIEKENKPMDDLIQSWYEESCVWDRVQVEDVEVLKKNLSPSLLMTLGRAAQSPATANMLHNSQLLGRFNIAIMDFLTYYGNMWATGSSDALPLNLISPSSVVAILEFFGELCRVSVFKTEFGFKGSIFWLPLLKLLSTLPENLKTSYFGSIVYDIETVFISFLSKCCWTHPENQNIIASCLCETIVSQKSSTHKAVFLHSMSSFCRRLLIQLLLENEKLIVHVKSQLKYPLKCPSSSVPLHYKHPSMGVCGGDRMFLIATHSNVDELLKMIDPFEVPVDPQKIINDANQFWNLLKKEQQGYVVQDMLIPLKLGGENSTKKLLELKRPIKMANKKLKCDGGLQDFKKEEGKQVINTLILECVEFPDCSVPSTVQLTSIVSAIRQHNPDSILDTVTFTLRNEVTTQDVVYKPAVPDIDLGKVGASSGTRSTTNANIPAIFQTTPITTTIEVFSRLGGLALLARHLPVVYPETLRQIAIGSKGPTGAYGNMMSDPSNPLIDNDWVKVENAEEFYDEMMDGMISNSSGMSAPMRRAPTLRQLTSVPGIPPHALAAFGLFLGLPGFADILLREREGAQCMLRLVMGVTDDADGNNIFGTSVAKGLPTLPFNVLRCLLDDLPISSDEGAHLRRVMIDMKAVHFIVACLAVFTHQTCDPALVPGLQHELVIAATKAQSGYGDKTDKSDDKSHVYWAKGTGFGTGSTAQSWDIELAMQKKLFEEENVTCFLQVLSSFIRQKERNLSEQTSNNLFMADVKELFKQSCLLPAIASYLRNDSVLDMARHIPLYKSVLLFLRSLISNQDLLPLLLPSSRRPQAETTDEESISKLLTKMKDIVDNYSKRLSSSKKNKSKIIGKLPEDLEDEGLAVLIPDIQTTAVFVEKAVENLMKKQAPSDIEMMDIEDSSLSHLPKSLEDRYVEEMKQLQFAFYDFTTENEDGSGINFTVSYHYENNVKSNFAKSFPARLKRLAQESVTLSNSLPIAYGSTIFVRSDTDRLDVMKVLITGPAATPYSNGCFEFDIYFPADYPSSPMMVNLETTGRQRVRFNPNLYSDGKVCLSILNTWHGRPEEKWNPQTSSLLTVLVAIQSLILTAEPYFNEPGYEKSRGTDAGERNSREYNAGIQIATLEWAMLDQIKNPSACFKEIIHKHFWLKRNEIIAQCDQWLQDLIVTCQNDKKAGKSVTGSNDPVTVFKNNLVVLKKELAKLPPIPGYEDVNELNNIKKEQQAESMISDIEGQDSNSKSSDSKMSESSPISIKVPLLEEETQEYISPPANTEPI